MYRFFSGNINKTTAEIVITGTDANHMANVLRLRMGAEVIICDGAGSDFVCEIIGFGKNEVRLFVLSYAPNDAELGVEVFVFQGMPKADKFELVIQKGTELGAVMFVPFVSEFSTVKADKKQAERKAERWQAISQSAAMQSGRGIIPRVMPPATLINAISFARELDLNHAVVLYEKENSSTFKAFAQNIKNGDKVGLFVGPEGGFSEKEIELFAENNITPVTLGKRILRTETAALAALAAISYETGEF